MSTFRRRSTRLLSAFVVPLLIGTPSSAAAAEPVQWLGGPWPLDASPARNPDVDVVDGHVHIVYRLRDGGVGHIAGPSMGVPTSELVVPGSVATAAVARHWNFPRVAVDEAGAGHVVWGPLSTDALRGTWYAKIDADGVPVLETRRLTDRWVEDIDVAVTAGEVHVLVNAIGSTPGLYDWTGSVGTGPTAEVQVSPAGTFRELSLGRREGGLSAIGRFTRVERVDLGPGGWGTVERHDEPGAPFTSVGFPRAIYGDSEVWAAMAWTDATPVSVVTRRGGAWETLSLAPPYDPLEADGGSPSVAMARDGQGRVAVAWLAAEGDRLRISVADPEWSVPVALPQTADATSLELSADVEGLRVVYATEDGSLYTGRLGVPEPEPEPESGSTGGTGGPPAEEDTGVGSGDGSDELEDESGSSGELEASTGGDEGGELVTVWSRPQPEAGCSCRSTAGGGWLPWAAGWLMFVGRRGRRRRSRAG